MASTSKRSSSFNEDSKNDNKRVKSSQLVTGGSESGDNASEPVMKDASTVSENKLEAKAPELRTASREGAKAIAEGLSSSFDYLPTKILLVIIGHVEDFLDRHRLRVTSLRLHALIHCPFASSPPSHGDLVQLEQSLAHKILIIGCRKWMVCGECLRLRPTRKFSPTAAPIPGEMRLEFAKSWRICVDCGKRPLPEEYKTGDENTTLRSGLYRSVTVEHYFPPGRWWMDENGRRWVRCIVCWRDRGVSKKRTRVNCLPSACMKCVIGEGREKECGRVLSSKGDVWFEANSG